MTRWLIDDWRSAHKFWTIRIAALWGAVSGLLLVWPAFANAMPLWAYALGGVLISAAIAVARVTKQPGVE